MWSLPLQFFHFVAFSFFKKQKQKSLIAHKTTYYYIQSLFIVVPIFVCGLLYMMGERLRFNHIC